jgi:dTDP-4-amino-4,6-dideoxygalactose transaminase
MARLAMLGGPRTVPRELRVEWPIVTEADERAVLRALRSGRLVANAQGEEEVRGLEREWAAYLGVRHCAAVGSGTAALQLALAALGVGPGDEVIVPALTFSATALAVLQQQAAPVFVDVSPDTFDLDPGRLEEAITPRTRAIVAVHLHGLPADMDEILAVAARHGLTVVEDAAQAHGATYRGRPVGSIGAIAGFSLHPSKNLPACGEGGLVTTDHPRLHADVTMRREFGEVVAERHTRTYVSHLVGWNHKLSPVQAAFARSQLARFRAYGEQREANVRRLLGRLGELPGLRVPRCPPDRTHAWHILRFRIDPAALGLDDAHPGALRHALHRALRAEGVPVSRYQVLPLPGHPLFQEPPGAARGQRRGSHDGPAPDYRLERFPVALAVLEDSLCLQRRHLNPFGGEALGLYAEGFAKVWENLEVVARVARGRPDGPVPETAGTRR